MVMAVALGWSVAPVTAMPVETPASTAPEAKAAGMTYYLVQRVSLTTDAGVRSLYVGTKVTLVKREKSGMKIRLSDGIELVVTPDQLTQDSALAEQLADEERGKAAAAAEEARANAAARTAAEAARREKEVADAQDYLRQAQNAPPSAPPATPRPWGLTGSALDTKPEVVARIRPQKKRGK